MLAGFPLTKKAARNFVGPFCKQPHISHIYIARIPTNFHQVQSRLLGLLLFLSCYIHFPFCMHKTSLNHVKNLIRAPLYEAKSRRGRLHACERALSECACERAR
jgi:hypothetical protein